MIQGEESIVVSGVQTKLEPLLRTHLTLTIVENELKYEKVMDPQSTRESRTQKKKQITKHYKGPLSNIQIIFCMLLRCY
jgi:hypothetical protein